MPSSIAGSIGASLAGNVLGSVLGPDTPDAPNYQTWQPGYTGQADQQWYNLSQANQKNNPYQQYAQQFQDVYNKQYNNPYAAQAQTASNNAGNAYTTIGNQSVGNAQNLGGQSMAMLPYIQQILQTSLDPQGALYNRTLQQTQDQQRVGQAARGVTMSPYGAGLENQALNNFNIDWQNNALQRQATGLGSATSALTGATNTASAANNLGTAGAGAIQQGGALPYQTAQGQGTDQYNALSNLVNSSLGTNQLNSANMAALLSYMGLGANQSNAQGGFTQQNYMNQLKEAQTAGGGLSSLIGQGVNYLGSPSSSLPWMTNGANLVNQASMFFA